MGANKQANIEVTYQGTNKRSAAPFGGVMVLEYNSTITSVSCTGEDLVSSNPYQVTYTTASTAHTSKQYAFGKTLDDGTGSVRRITCQYLNGATPVGVGTPSAYRVNIIPANYYVSQEGSILLDTEKAADDSNTRTGSVFSQPSQIGYWGT